MLKTRLGLLVPVLIVQAACTTTPVSRRVYDEPLPEPEPEVAAEPRATPRPIRPPPQPPRRAPVPSDPVLTPSEPEPAAPEPAAEVPAPPPAPQVELPPVAEPPATSDYAFTPAAAPPVIVALRGEAAASLQSGELDNAAAALERAIRIQPNNAELWHQLAAVRLRQGQPALAEDLAQRSNLQAHGRPDLVRANWALIADARRQRGDTDGALAASLKAGH